jgi:hypothetical protein
VNLEKCSGCGVKQWGWHHNGYGAGVAAPFVRFAASGSHTVRVQTREDGFSIDQIVLSSGTYKTAAPGALKNDTTKLPEYARPASGGPPEGGHYMVVENVPAATEASR